MEKFFSFFKSFLGCIDGGSFFRDPVKWLYMVLAGLNVLAPFFILIKAIDSGMLGFLSGSGIVAFILIWIVLLAGFICLGLLWWYRRDLSGVFDEKNPEFPVTPIFAHIVRTAGEWLGILVGVISPVVLLIALIFLGSDASFILRGLPGAEGSWINIIILPVAGFLILVFSRFVAEQIKVLVTIARNTRK